MILIFKMELLEASKLVQNGWEETFKDAIPELKHISTLLDVRKKLGTYYPKPEDCFNAFKLCSLENIKVILVDYQPYYGTVSSEGKVVSKATGLSFSVRNDDAIPKSIKNMYTELKNTIPEFQAPEHGNLEEWAKQGVLLINNTLTVSQQKLNIDVSELWYGFLNKIFKAIKKSNPNVIVLLWGRKVQCITKILPDSFVILETLSQPDGYKADTEFLGCNHFTKVNELLEKQNKTKIIW